MKKIELSADLYLEDICREFNLELTPAQKRNMKKEAIGVLKMFKEQANYKSKFDFSPSEEHVVNILIEKLLRKYYDR